MVQPLEVEIPAIHHIEGTGFRRDAIQDVHVMHFAVGDADEQGDVAMQIDQRVHLHRALALTETSPREHCQTQIDGRRVESIGAMLELRAERVMGVQHAGVRDEDLREISEDVPVVTFVSVGQRRPRNPAADAHVIQLVRRGPQAGFNVS